MFYENLNKNKKSTYNIFNIKTNNKKTKNNKN
jgi:hypothetical protein